MSVTITYFVPCYNEQDNVVPTIEMILAVMKSRRFSFDVLVFDDASTDKSAQNVKNFLQKNPEAPVKLIENNTTKGLGRNYLTGAQMASGEHYMMVCGDNDTPPETLNFMLDQLGKADMIVPYLLNLDERPFGRRMFSKGFTQIVRLFSSSRLRYYNGIVLHKTSTVRKYAPSSSGFAYQAEILCRALANGLSYIEVPIRTVPQVAFFKTSAFRFKNILSVARSLVRILINRAYHTRSLGKQNEAFPSK